MSDYVNDNEDSLKRARDIRNELLNKTYKYFLIDYPIQCEHQLIIKKYRQELRQFININKEKILNGEVVYFPEKPDFLDLI